MFSFPYLLLQLLTIVAVASLWTINCKANVIGAIGSNEIGDTIYNNKQPPNRLLNDDQITENNLEFTRLEKHLQDSDDNEILRSGKQTSDKRNDMPNMINTAQLHAKNDSFVVVTDDPQKRTKLKEKELLFYGDLYNPRHGLIRSKLKGDNDKYSSIKSFYGSKDNPAKSCRDIFLTDRRAKSGNYYIRTSDDELLMVTCGFPEINETLVSEDDMANTTSDGESYYGHEKVVTSDQSLKKRGDDMEKLKQRSETNTNKEPNENITSNNTLQNKNDQEKGSNETGIKPILKLENSGQNLNSMKIKNKDENDVNKNIEEPVKKEVTELSTKPSDDMLGAENNSIENSKTSSSNSNDLKEVLISNSKGAINNSKEGLSDTDTPTPNPTGIPINYVLPSKTKIIMKAESADEIKDLTKPLNSVVKTPGDSSVKEKDRKETTQEKLVKDEKKENEKEDNKKEEKKKEDDKQEEKLNDKKITNSTKENGKEILKPSKSQPPKNPQPNYEPTTTTTPVSYNTLIPKMPTTKKPLTTKPLETTTSTTKPLENHPSTTAAVPTNRKTTPTTSPPPSSPSPTSPTPSTPKPPTTAPFRYTEPKLSPNPKLAGQIGREQYKNFDKNPNTPERIDFPPASSNDYLSRANSPNIPSYSRPPEMLPPRPSMGYGYNGRPMSERTPYYPPPPPRESYGPPRPYPPRPLVRPPYYGQLDRDRFDVETPYFKEQSNVKNVERSEEKLRSPESPKVKLSPGNAVGNAGDLGDVPEEHPPPLSVTHQANMDKEDSLYGKRDTRTDSISNEQEFRPQKQYDTKGLARSVSWAFHEGLMKNEMNFDHQYKDFEEMDEKIDSKHKKENEDKQKETATHENVKSQEQISNGKNNEYIKTKEVQEKAKTRSWEVNRQQMVKEVAKQQYDDFEKTPQQIKQDQASKTYQQQYEDFENFKAVTANNNPENTTEAKASNPEAYSNPENQQDKSNAAEVTKLRQDQQSTTDPLVQNKTNSELSNRPVHKIKNNSSLHTGNSTGKTKFTDYYKEYMDEVDSGFDTIMTNNTIPTFPNSTVTNNRSITNSSTGDLPQYYSNSKVTKNTNELIQMPLTPLQLVTNAPLGESTRNVTTTFDNNSVPIQQVNATVAVVSKKTTELDPLQNIANLISKLLENPRGSDEIGKVKKNEELLAQPRLTEQAETRSSLILRRLPNTDDSGATRNMAVHSLRQISGPPNPLVKEHLSLARVNVQTNTNSAKNKNGTNAFERSLLELHNLTGHSELVKSDIDEDEIKKSILKRLLKADVPIEDLDIDSAKYSLHHILKDMEIPQHEQSVAAKEGGTQDSESATKEIEVGKKAIGDTASEEKIHTTNKKFKSIPNAYNFIIPETRKFAVSDKTDDEKEVLGERVISARQKSKLLEQRRRVELIKAQALSPKEPSMGRFSTANLKHFAYHKHSANDMLEDPVTYFGKTDEKEELSKSDQVETKKPEAIVLLVPSDVNKITSHLGLVKDNENYAMDSTQHSQFHKDLYSKRGDQNVVHLNNHLEVSRLVKDNPKETNVVEEKLAPSTSSVFRKSDTTHGTLTGSVRSQVKQPSEDGGKEDTKSNVNISIENNSKDEEPDGEWTFQPTTSYHHSSIKNKGVSDIFGNSISEQIRNRVLVENDIQATSSNKKQNVTRINDGLFGATLNMADMITQAQMEMENIPGLTEENKKVDEKSGSVNETLANIKAEEERIKQKVNKEVKEANEENQRQAQQQVQENQPFKDHDVVVRHNINAEALPGMEKRSVIFGKPRRRNENINESHIPPFIKESIDVIRKEQDRVKQEIQEIQKESTSDLMKQQYQNHMKTYKQAQGFIQNTTNRVNPNTTLTNIKKRRLSLKHHKNKKNKSESNKTTRKMVLKSLKENHDLLAPTGSQRSHHNFQKPIRGNVKSKNQPQHILSNSSLIKPFFKEEQNSVDISHITLPEVKDHIQEVLWKGNNVHQIDGNILGSTARRFRKYELNKFTSKRQRKYMQVKINKHNLTPYESLVKTLRGLIPSAVGNLSPSSDVPLPPVGSDPPTKPPSAPTPTDPTSLSLSNMLNEVINLQKQSQQINNQTSNEKTEDTSPTEEDGQPHADSGPQDDERSESEKQAKRPAKDSNSGHGESGKDEVGTNVSNSKMAHKDQKSDDSDKKIGSKTEGSKQKNADKTFEEGLKEATDHGYEEIKSENSKEKSSNSEYSDPENESLKPTTQIHDNAESRAPEKQQKPEEGQSHQEGKQEEQLAEQQEVHDGNGDGSLQLKIGHEDSGNGENNTHSISQPVNITALELGIINLINQTIRKTHATTAHGKKMEQLNHKYGQLKLPIEHGELLPDDEDNNPNDKLPNRKIEEALNHTKALVENGQHPQLHKNTHPILPPRQSSQPEMSLNPTRITEVIDATPTESGGQQDNNEKSDSNESSNNNPSREQTDSALNQKSPDYIPETITIHLPKNSGGNEEDDKSQEQQDINKSDEAMNLKPEDGKPIKNGENTIEGDGQTPAELAKKIATVLNSVNVTRENPTISSLKPSLSGETTSEVGSNKAAHVTSLTNENPDVGNITLPVSTLSSKAGENSIPIIPIPMDSELGKLLYPALNGQVPTKPLKTSTPLSPSPTVPNQQITKVDGTDYSSILIDQARKLLSKNKLKRKDLIKLLKTSHAINDVQSQYEKKNNIRDNTRNSLKQQHSKLNTKSEIVNKNSNTIHINLKRKDGYLILEPDKLEAYQRKLVPHNVGLYTAFKEQKKNHIGFSYNKMKQQTQISIKKDALPLIDDGGN